jgi:hypothetical protein
MFLDGKTGKPADQAISAYCVFNNLSGIITAQASIPNNLEIAEASRPTGEKSEKPMRAQSLDFRSNPTTGSATAVPGRGPPSDVQIYTFSCDR